MKKLLILSFTFLLCFNIQNSATNIPVEDIYDFQLAIEFAMSNNIDTLILVSDGGIYTTTDTNFFFIHNPLTIIAQEGLSQMPTITHSAADSSVLEIFRIAHDFTIKGVILDGGHEVSHGMKYALRAGDGPDENPIPHHKGLNITVKNCVFKNIYRDKDPDGQGHGLYFLKFVEAGDVLVENCTFQDIGDEAIRMTETEKWDTERCLESLTIRNCSFTNIDAECIRFYGDTDTETPDAPVLIENISVNRSASRMMYIKNNFGTQVRNVIVTNARMPGSDRADRADYVMQIQGVGSYISHVDTMNYVFGVNKKENTIESVKGGDLDETTIFGFDPQYEDEANFDLRLKPTSHAYFSGKDNVHLGDLNNAVAANPQVSPLNVEIVGNGSVQYSPERKGLTFVTGVSVTITATPDSGYKFVGWTGDVTSTNSVETINVDGIKNVIATFDISTDVEDEVLNVSEYSLSQNYPNPFNPSTLISFGLKEAGETTIKIFDALGREVDNILSKDLSAGSHSIIFDGSDLSSGIYFYQIQSGDFVATKKMMLIK